MSVQSGRTGPNHYEILKVDSHATEEEIKKSYRELVQIWHPDFNRHNPKMAEERTKKINEAYRLLINKTTRARYDQTLRRQWQGPAAKDENGGAPGAGLLKQFWLWLKAGDSNG